MKTLTKFGSLLAVILVFGAAVAMAGDEAAPTVDEKMAGLVGMCENSASDRAARQEKESLYDRLGGYDKIHALTKEIVRLHAENEDFRLMMNYIDHEKLAKHVADFTSAGTGGDATYSGRNMVDAHKRMQMTQGDFLSAGGDVIQAMKNMGYEQNEIDEFVCILVSMKDMVIYK